MSGYVPVRDQEHTGDNGDPITYTEVQAIRALQRLGRKWPRSLRLISMDGQLYVMHTDDPRFTDEYGREAVVLARIDGIPSDGGGW